MPGDDDRTWADLTARNERLRELLRETPSPEQVVRNVTTAFRGDVARIMRSAPSRPGRAPPAPADHGRDGDEA